MKGNLERTTSKNYSNTTRLVLGAIYTALAAIFQSAGIFTGIGYAFSILTTLPIILAAQLSIKIGLLSYFLTLLLLWILQPSELLVFPFTTGFLGMALGIAIKWWNGWLIPSIFGGIALSAGIMLLLYIIRFPILGPSFTDSFNLVAALIIMFFSLFYSLIWVGVTKKFTFHLQKILKKKTRHPD